MCPTRGEVESVEQPAFEQGIRLNFTPTGINGESSTTEGGSVKGLVHPTLDDWEGE